jgi:hypothetical protein
MIASASPTVRTNARGVGEVTVGAPGEDTDVHQPHARRLPGGAPEEREVAQARRSLPATPRSRPASQCGADPSHERADEPGGAADDQRDRHDDERVDDEREASRGDSAEHPGRRLRTAEEEAPVGLGRGVSYGARDLLGQSGRLRRQRGSNLRAGENPLERVPHRVARHGLVDDLTGVRALESLLDQLVELSGLGELLRDALDDPVAHEGVRELLGQRPRHGAVDDLRELRGREDLLRRRLEGPTPGARDDPRGVNRRTADRVAHGGPPLLGWLGWPCHAQSLPRRGPRAADACITRGRVNRLLCSVRSWLETGGRCLTRRSQEHLRARRPRMARHRGPAVRAGAHRSDESRPSPRHQ